MNLLTIFISMTILSLNIQRIILKDIAPEKVDIVKLYKNKAPILEYFGIDKQIKTSFGRTVSLKNGAYLVIEHTEALHVIDVNSGHKVRSESNQEVNALDVNIEAAVEIARQISLRDLGGIIVIDFIDMRDLSHKKMLYEKVLEAMTADRARHTVLPVNRFGLVHITRQSVRPEMNIDILEKCPVCDGTGQIKASIILIDEIETNHDLPSERTKSAVYKDDTSSLCLCLSHQRLILHAC